MPKFMVLSRLLCNGNKNVAKSIFDFRACQEQKMQFFKQQTLLARKPIAFFNFGVADIHRDTIFVVRLANSARSGSNPLRFRKLIRASS